MASDTELEHAVLIAEYNQKQETFRTHMRLFGQLVIIYLAITGVSVNYALQKDARFENLLLLGTFDILAGALGSVVAFTVKRIMRQLDARLGQISYSLGIQHERTPVFDRGVWAAFLLYMCICAAWLYIFVCHDRSLFHISILQCRAVWTY